LLPGWVRGGGSTRDLWMGRLGRGRPGDAGTGQAPTVPSQVIGNGKPDAMRCDIEKCSAVQSKICPYWFKGCIGAK
jgi:hypothetical protein